MKVVFHHSSRALLVVLGGALVFSCKKAPVVDRVEATSQQAQASASTPSASEPASTQTRGARPLDPAPEGETVEGYRLIRARIKDGGTTAIRIQPPKGWDIVQAPTEPDPQGGKLSLADATKGLAKSGVLAAHIKTSMGSFYCDLFADKTPNTVANFVGLARGMRKFWDAEKLAWVARHYYDGTTFHRVIPGFMIQGGDHTGTGRGGIGYTIPDEMHPTLHHDRAGQLCMANRGPNTNEAQFFITEGAAPHLEGSYTIFGQCEPATLVQRIARVPQSGAPDNQPLTAVTIEQIEIRRIAGGAAAWIPASAKLPPMPGVAPPVRAVQVPATGAPTKN
jgi:peptidyl-prolyl cis-trans isomerase A (cyclophilin A)